MRFAIDKRERQRGSNDKSKSKINRKPEEKQEDRPDLSGLIIMANSFKESGHREEVHLKKASASILLLLHVKQKRLKTLRDDEWPCVVADERTSQNTTMVVAYGARAWDGVISFCERTVANGTRSAPS